jgi:N-methylhydantoinase B
MTAHGNGASRALWGGQELDPIRFEVIRNALVAATDEMAATLRRSAYSTNVKTRADFSCSFFDRDLRVVAQAFTQPVHLGSLVELVPRAVRTFGVARLEPGDMLVTNDPYAGGVHLNDITVIAPVHHEAEIVGYLATLAHHVDVGGGAPASVAAFREVFQEGVIIPPVRLVAGGQIVDDVFRLILAQIRSKHETAGDFRAQVAANTTGLRRVLELFERYGAPTVRQYMDALIAYTRLRTGAEIGRLPYGTYTAEGSLDFDGFTDRPVRLVVRIEIDDAGVFFDLEGCDPQRRAPVNSTYAQTYSACAYALKALLDPDLPVNAGFYESVRLNAPLGSVVNARPPAPVVGGWETQVRVNDLFFKALSTGLPAAVPAGTKAMQCHAGFGGIDPRSGEYYCFLETLAGGYGGRAERDGPDAVQSHGQNTENAPVEETEANYPVRIVRYELVPDSEGPGRRRGGLGLRRDYLFAAAPTTFTILADRDRAGPWGLFGGEAGLRASYVLNPDTPRERTLSSKVTLELEPGDVVSYRTCGGGGYGPAREREPERVATDVREGKVSSTRARDIYRVAIDEHGQLDPAETARLRGDLV